MTQTHETWTTAIYETGRRAYARQARCSCGWQSPLLFDAHDAERAAQRHASEGRALG